MTLDAGRAAGALVPAVAVGLAACGLYTLTAARDIGLGDSAELVTVAATLGVAHPPGYPLLSLFGHALTWLPVGPVPFRVNLLSVLAGAGTTIFVVLIALRLTRHRVAAALAALLLAVHPLFWEWSLVIEVFSLNACLASAEIYWLIRWDAEPDRIRWFVLAVATGALATANHQTIIFVVPAALMILWRHRARLVARPAAPAAAAAVALAGLSVYLYIPWAAARNPFINWGDVSSASDLLHHFLRTTYGTLRLTSAAGASSSGTPADRLAILFSSCSLAEAILVPLGALVAFRRARTFFWISMLTVGFAGPVFAIVSNLNTKVQGFAWVLQRFFLLPHVVAAPLQAVAIAALSAWLARRLPRRKAWLADAALAIGGITVVAVMAATEYRAIDQRDNYLARTYAEDILATMPPDAVLLAGTDDVVLPVAYLQAVEHRRPDVTLVMLGPLTRGDWYVRELRARDPRLVFPFDHYNPANGSATIRALVQANPGRPFLLVGPPQDASLEAAYWYLPRGLALAIEPQTRDVPLSEVARENERLFAAYRIPPADLAGHSNFDPYVLRAYSTGARQVGLQYQAAQVPADAIAWFRRALAIDPSDGLARALLRQAGGTAR
jgi:glycosyltransferase A (GT-A) superfamily protein (DUF2064 family)